MYFADLKESDTTKHIHRLHPYKGKFIPQLVEYFLDNNIDDFKKEKFFNPGDIILDTFCGSGTTLAQANELGLHAIGVDVSALPPALAAKFGNKVAPAPAETAAPAAEAPKPAAPAALPADQMAHLPRARRAKFGGGK